MTKRKPTPPAEEPTPYWEIMYVGRSTNISWKVIYRHGSLVIHADHLTEEQAKNWSQEDCTNRARQGYIGR